MQSTGHTSTQAVSLMPIHGSQMMYAITLIILAYSLAYSCDPTLAALFTPAHPRLGRYEVCTTADAIETLAGADPVQTLDPRDAFGDAGRYDRGALSRLYGG